MKLYPRRLAEALALFSAFTLILTILAMGIKIQQPAGSQPNAANSLPFSSYFCVLVAALAVLCIQTWVNYKKGWFNPTWALKYQDLLESKQVRKARSISAKQFKADKKYDKSRKDVEIVLDVFEDIGFYVKHDEISVEVAHHHFYHWIRGYVQTADGYIAEYRRDDPLAYEHCKFVLEAVSEFEAKKSHKNESELHWDEDEINEFLEEEAGMADDLDDD